MINGEEGRMKSEGFTAGFGSSLGGKNGWFVRCNCAVIRLFSQ